MSTPRQLAKVKHKPVPAALHAELSEYSSLLRAIRASDTLDVTSQLTRYYVGKGKEKAVQVFEDEDGAEANADGHEFQDRDELPSNLGSDDYFEAGSSRLSSEAPLKQIRNAAPSSPVMGEARPGKGEAGKERSKRPSSHETWTRWPLLAEDVPVPEWTLEDEVAQLTTFLLCSEPISTSEIDSNCDSDLDMNSSPELISSLTFASTHILDGILASLATIIPKRPPSMSNRLAPVGWQTVLAAAQVQAAGQRGGGLSGLSPSIKVLERVERRLKDLYGTSPQLNSNHGNAVSGPSTDTALPRVILTSPRKSAIVSLPQSQSSAAVTLTLSASAPTPAPLSSLSPPPNPLLSSYLTAQRVQILRDSSEKLFAKFSSYGASPSDLFSADIGYPGMGYSIPDGWADKWYASHAAEKKKLKKQITKEKRREEKERKRIQREAREASRVVTLARKRGGNRRGKKQVEPSNVSNADYNGDDASGGDNIVNMLGKRKRRRDDLEGSDGPTGEEEINQNPEKAKSRKKSKFKSAKLIDESD